MSIRYIHLARGPMSVLIMHCLRASSQKRIAAAVGGRCQSALLSERNVHIRKHVKFGEPVLHKTFMGRIWFSQMDLNLRKFFIYFHSPKPTTLPVSPVQEPLESGVCAAKAWENLFLWRLLIGNASDCSQVKADCNGYYKCMQIASAATD